MPFAQYLICSICLISCLIGSSLPARGGAGHPGCLLHGHGRGSTAACLLHRCRPGQAWPRPAQPGRRCPAAQPAGPGARQGRRAACCCATWQWSAAGRWCSGRRPWTRVACAKRDRSAIADRIDQRQDDSCRGSRKYRGAKGAFHPPKYKRKKKKREKILQMVV